MNIAFFLFALGAFIALVGLGTWTVSKIAGIDSEFAEVGGVTAMSFGACCLVFGLALMGIEGMA